MGKRPESNPARFSAPSSAGRSRTDCSVCSGGYTAELSFTCSKCSHSAGGIALAAILAVAVLVVAVAVVLYVMSGQVEAGRQGMVERLGRFIPLHSVKIVIVAWQILTQVSVEVG